MTTEIDAQVWLRHSWHNRIQTVLLLLVMAAFLALLGNLLWGPDGVWFMLMVGSLSFLISPSVSPALVMRMYHAQRLDPSKMPELYAILRELAEKAELPRVPDIYYVPSSMLNAFAVGSQQNSAIAVTDGLLRHLTQRELRAVLAHEISHIRNEDLLVMGMADMFSRATSTLSLMGQILLFLNLPLILLSGIQISWFAILLLVFAPTLSALAQLALSRTREFDADLGAAWLTRDPDALASALTKIEKVQGGWLERVFMPGKGIPEPSLLRTHPLTQERVARLMSLKKRFDMRPPSNGGNSVLPSLDRLGDAITEPPRWHIGSGLWR